MLIIAAFSKSRPARSANVCLAVLFCVMLTSCASKSGNPVSREEFNHESSKASVNSLNNAITNRALLSKTESDESVYLLGPGDILELSVFRVEELNSTVRINGNGKLMLPLIGLVEVAGKSVSEAEIAIAQALSKDYLQDAQVSLFVTEYRSQQITVMGEVNSPDIYNVTRPRTVMEMLSIAGGISSEAADTVRVSTTQPDSRTGAKVKQNYLLNLKALLSDHDGVANLRLAGGDAIYVPAAGVVYVEGAVEKPGAYKINGDVNVLQAISMAGGIPWAGNQGSVRIVRQLADRPVSLEVNLNKIREQRETDVFLRDGDIIVVSYSGTKRVVSQFLKGVNSIVGFGYSLN